MSGALLVASTIVIKWCTWRTTMTWNYTET